MGLRAEVPGGSVEEIEVDLALLEVHSDNSLSKLSLPRVIPGFFIEGGHVLPPFHVYNVIILYISKNLIITLFISWDLVITLYISWDLAITLYIS